jgi:hypothetical protein
VVQPRREHAHAAQLAAVLVHVDVVGIVGPRAEIAERTERPAFDRLARNHPERAIVVSGALHEQAIDVASVERSPLSSNVPDGGLGVDFEVVAAERGQVVLGHVKS